MSLTAFFNNVIPKEIGKYNHTYDQQMAKIQNSGFMPPTSLPQTSPQTSAIPSVIVLNNSSYPAYYSQKIRRSTFVEKKQKDKGSSEPSIITALAFFSFAITAGAVGFAYSWKKLNKLTDNFLNNQKIVSTAIKSGLATFFGLAGLKIGITLGGYYGPVLIGSAFLGATLSGVLLIGAGTGFGILTGKYLSKLCFYIYTGGKKTKEKTFSLSSSAEAAINQQFETISLYSGSRPNLMYNYILNKIDVATQNIQKSPEKNTGQEWLATLKKYRQCLKSGKFSKQLAVYFDGEWAILRNDWFYTKSQTFDQRFVDHPLLQIEQDLKALAIITSKEETLEEDLHNKGNDILSLCSMPEEMLQVYQNPQSLYPCVENLAFAPSAPPIEEAWEQQQNYYPGYQLQATQKDLDSFRTQSEDLRAPQTNRVVTKGLI